MVIYYKFRIFCKTEGKYKYIWNQNPPDNCPSNPEHEIDKGLTYAAFEDKLDSDKIVDGLKKIRYRLDKKIENVDNKIKIILYYADWCMFSKNILPIWDEFEKYIDINMYGLQYQKQKYVSGDCLDEDGDSIQGFPTIILYLSGGKKEYFKDERTKENLIKFVENNLSPNDRNIIIKDSINKMINLVLDTTSDLESFIDNLDSELEFDEEDPNDLIVEI